jgi:hypothetical protein
LQQIRQTQVTFDPHARDIKLELAKREVALLPSRREPSAANHPETTATAKHSRSPPKPSEPAPQRPNSDESVPKAKPSRIPPKPSEPPPRPPGKTDLIQNNINLTLDDLRDVGEGFDDDVEAAMLEILNPMDEGTLLKELRNELGRLVPDEEAPVSSEADKKTRMSDHSGTPESKKRTNEGTERDRTIGSVEKPKPRELRRRNLHQDRSASGHLSPERRGVVTRNRPNTTSKPSGSGQ